MNKLIKLFLTLVTLAPLFACQTNKTKPLEIDNKSYLNDFELQHENLKGDKFIKIVSPRAILYPIKNDIEIFNSTIDITNNKGNKLQVKSENSTLNNSNNLIHVFNNVSISLIENKKYFIKTNSFNWDLNKSDIHFDDKLFIFFDDTIINSSGGLYNIDMGTLKLNNSIFNRNIFNNEGKKKYQISISSDNTKWMKNNNSLEFTSNNKQVETTINFLTIK